MEDQTLLIEVLFEKTGSYAKKSAELYKLKAIDRSADIISSLAVRTVVISIITLFFLVFNIGSALWISEKLGRSYYGFFTVAGFYALLGIVIYIFRDKWIKVPVRDSIIMQGLN